MPLLVRLGLQSQECLLCFSGFESVITFSATRMTFSTMHICVPQALSELVWGSPFSLCPNVNLS